MQLSTLILLASGLASASNTSNTANPTVNAEVLGQALLDKIETYVNLKYSEYPLIQKKLREELPKSYLNSKIQLDLGDVMMGESSFTIECPNVEFDLGALAQEKVVPGSG
ncbi:hypothetical protein G3M48_008198 [Beauveria asiatica]|uniref:Uncharacterized protein n=1 Tax=Beauveria asiatica TaxID=1069075 RepID=A0AAW0RL66_9HYPO